MKATKTSRVPLLWSALVVGFWLTGAAHANAQTRYEVTITNGSQMPISPAVLFVKSGTSSTAIGSAPSSGLVQLCQTGNVMARLGELRSDSTVGFVAQTNGPILPGGSQTVDIDVVNPRAQSIYFETMYGKTKDACGVSSINSHSLVALSQHVTTAIVQRDNAISTGAFNDPSLPQGMSYLDSGVCASAVDAISCLRTLATATSGMPKIRYFAGYLPSLITALELKYGASDVRTLQVPTAGAIQIKIKLKH